MIIGLIQTNKRKGYFFFVKFIFGLKSLFNFKNSLINKKKYNHDKIDCFYY
jgi:hypothetical protein